MVTDPAVVDRRSTSVVVVRDADLPSRSMSIAGTEGRIEARILSKDQSGPTTRLVRFPAAWGTATAGAFDARVEIFVIDGRLRIGSEVLGSYDFAVVYPRRVIGGVRAETATVALLMSEAPFRYDVSAGGSLAQAAVGRAAEIPWAPVSGLPGRFERVLFSSDERHVWLSGARHWFHEGNWHRHASPEEMFVLDGTLRLTVWGDETEPVEHGPGSYSYRLPDEPHAGPGSSSSEMAISFHRLLGPPTLEWAGQPDIT